MGQNNVSEYGNLILAVFDRNESGELASALDPRRFETVDQALQEARLIADQHTGVIVWMRETDTYLGEYGPVLFQSGDLPALE